jgi:hypothetical protein
VKIIGIPDEPVRDNRDPEEPARVTPAPSFEPGPVELGPSASSAVQNVVTTQAEPTLPTESSGFAAAQARNPLADIAPAEHEVSIELEKSQRADSQPDGQACRRHTPCPSPEFHA